MKSRVIRSRAPLRLGLGGGGTDVAPYSEIHGGAVLNVTIDLYANVSLQPRSDGVLRIEALDHQEVWEGPATADPPLHGGGVLAKGVYRHFIRRYNHDRPLAMTVSTYADVPAGSGLGTSSAMVVALVEAFARFFQVVLGPYDIAHLAYEIEREELKLSGGKQDQYAAAFGGFNFIEFGPGDGVLVNPMRISPTTLAEFESSLIVFFTGVSRESANIIDEQSTRVSGGDVESLDAMHKLKTGAFAMREALLRGQVSRLAEILDESYAQKRRTASSISTPHLDRVYAAAKSAGAIGGKVSGAGGGGFMMFLADAIDRPKVIRALEHEQGRIFACRLTDRGAFAWTLADERGFLLEARAS